MNPCPQCGATPQPQDKFCNVCGASLVAAPYGPPGRPGFPPQAPPAQGVQGAPYGPAMRCYLNHEFAPGASFCAHGHGAAPDGGPFAHDQYGAYAQPGPPTGFGGPQAPPQPPPPYGQPHYGAPAAPFPDPNAPHGYGQSAAYARPPAPASPPQAGFAYPAPAPMGPPYPIGNPLGPQGPHLAPPYGGPPPGYGGYGADPYAGGYAPQPGFGAPQMQQAPQALQAPQAPVLPAPPPMGSPDVRDHSQPQDSQGSQGSHDLPANLPPDALRGFLVSYQSNPQGDFWPLHGGRKTLGRANSGEQVDIPMSDATISSRHAAIIVDAAMGTVHVEDTGSTNGTFVNEEHIKSGGKRDLRDGDKLRFGGYAVIVKLITHV